MRMPEPRGEVSQALVAHLSLGHPHAPAAARLGQAARRLAARSPDPGADEDLQLSLLLCYELHYRGLDGVDDAYEWDAGVLAVRRHLEAAFAGWLSRACGDADHGGPVDIALHALVVADTGPALSTYVRRSATLAQVRELLVHRSVYQLKEADPHSWAIPRLAGRAKAALVEIQADEYGGGRYERMHATLFARTMRALALDDTYGAYVDLVPATTLATTNAISMFGLNRSRRGALAGHLAAFEMTSSVPNRRYGDGLRRLGYDRHATEFFDEHVEADAVHEQVAAADLCGGLLAQEPQLRADVLLGAAACLLLDGRANGQMLTAWKEHQPSLRPPTVAQDACA